MPGTPYHWRHNWNPRDIETAFRYRKGSKVVARLRKEGAPHPLDIRAIPHVSAPKAPKDNGLRAHVIMSANPKNKAKQDAILHDLSLIHPNLASRVSEHFAGYNDRAPANERVPNGIHLSEGNTADSADAIKDITLRHKRGVKTSAAFYVGNSRIARIIISNGRHGSASVAIHETGHALDHALGRNEADPQHRASKEPGFMNIYKTARKNSNFTYTRTPANGIPEVHTVSLIAPYYKNKARELFAESFAIWTKNRNLPAEKRQLAIAHGLSPMGSITVGGTEITPALNQTSAYTKKLDDFFIKLEGIPNASA